MHDDEPLDLGEIEPGQVARWKSRDGKTIFAPDGEHADDCSCRVCDPHAHE